MPPRKLVLHVGLPKAASSALQSWCDRNREHLLAHDVNYPGSANKAEPKHQFLVPGLCNNKLEKLDAILAENRSPTLVLSTEGLTNHLYDFRPAALQQFRDMTQDYDVVAFMVAREKHAWMRSYYKQAVINPPVIPGFRYATALRYEDFRALPRVRMLTDMPALKEDLEVAFGARKVVVASYEGDWMADFLRLTGIDEHVAPTNLERIHVSISDDLTEIIRQVNAMMLPQQDRNAFLAVIQACFKTDHLGLKLWYKLAAEPCHGIDGIVSRLVAETPAQAALINQLSRWLADNRDPAHGNTDTVPPPADDRPS